MNEDNYILLLFGYFPQAQHHNGPYLVLSVVDGRGAVDNHALSNALNDSLGKTLDESNEIRFQSLDELNKFSYTLIDELDAPMICLLSNESYNICLEKASSLDEFKSSIMEASNKIENVDYSKDKGILSKLF